MKYIILYRKLGYSEIKQDIFAYTYSDTTITIESEKQLFNFLGNQYHLKEYKDFVILECIDRLLKKGYLSTDILLNDVNYDMIITCNNQPIFKILAAGWDDYEKFISGYHHQSSESDEIVVLYTSQLSVWTIFAFMPKKLSSGNLWKRSECFMISS